MLLSCFLYISSLDHLSYHLCSHYNKWTFCSGSTLKKSCCTETFHSFELLMSHLLQINDDASRVLGATTVSNLASYGGHSGSDLLPLDQAPQQSCACSLHHPFTPTTGSPSIQTLHEEISYVNAKQFNRILKRRETRNQGS